MTHRFRTALLGAVMLPVALLPGACAVGPDYATPPPPTAEGYIRIPTAGRHRRHTCAHRRRAAVSCRAGC